MIIIKKVLLNEMKRSLLNKKYCFAMIIVTIYLFVYFICRLVPLCTCEYTNCINDSEDYIVKMIFFMLLPFLVVSPFGTSYFQDIKQGYLKSIYTRVERQQYLFSKYIAIFISGGSVAILPVMMDLFESFLLRVLCKEYAQSLNYILSQMFVEQPVTYALIYLLLMFMFFGTLACVSLPITYYLGNSLSIYLLPFCVGLLITIIIQLSHFKEIFCIGVYLYGVGGDLLLIGTFAITLILSAISFVPYYFIGLKKDIV